MATGREIGGAPPLPTGLPVAWLDGRLIGNAQRIQGQGGYRSPFNLWYFPGLFAEVPHDANERPVELAEELIIIPLPALSESRRKTFARGLPGNTSFEFPVKTIERKK